MTLIELLIIALGLSADAFAVSIGKGLLQTGGYAVARISARIDDRQRCSEF